jgi:PAS domain S-box-containing protein
MNPQRQKPPTPWPMIVLFVVISISVVVVGVLYYSNQKKSLLSEKQVELSAISEMKISQINQWRREQIKNGEFLGGNILLVSKFSEFLQKPANNSLRNDILQSLKSLTETFDFKIVLLLDPSGSVRLAYPEQDTLKGDYLKSLLPEIVMHHKVVLSDLHRDSIEGFVHLDLIVPLIDRRLSDSLICGLLALKVNPQDVLYPLIRSWPTPSKSAESILIRRDRNEIVYLNKLRYLNNAELVLRKPVSSKMLVEAKAIKGIVGAITGIDYRNEPVVAAIQKITETTWYMISKIDRDEVFTVLNNQIRMVIIIEILFILAIGFFLGFLWWNQRVRFYREKYEDELNHLALVKHFDYILKFANDIILLIDSNLNIVEANDCALESYMYSRDEFIGMKLEKIHAPETLSQLSEQIKYINEKGAATIEAFHIRKDGVIFPIEISARVVNIEGSKYYQSIGRDITERKIVEDSLRESEEKFRKIFVESPFPMVMTEKDFGIIRANLSFCKMIGYKEEELKSFTFRNFTHPDYKNKDEVSLLELITGEIPIYNTEKKYIRKDGSIIWGMTTVSLIRNNKDEVQYFLAMVEDITSRKKIEADLIDAKEKAEESDRLKTAFLHNISHEIRTPMNAIIGFSTLLNDPELPEPERRQFTDIIFQSSNQLLSIIDDILDIANFESGHVKLYPREMDLNSSLRNLHEQFRLKESEYNIKINLSTGLRDEESIIVTDSTKLIEIISNLISNSIKFTRKGKIDFGYVLNSSFLEFFVRDTGIGISAEYIEKIFDRFYQVDAAVTRQYGGTGLGLSICKAYVELLGGKIGVTSKPDEGTLFKFTLPYNKRDSLK